MSKQSKHTKTPWQYIPSGKKLDGCFMIGIDSSKSCHGIAQTMDNNFISKKESFKRQEANAKFIVEAINSFEALKKRNEALEKDLIAALRKIPVSCIPGYDDAYVHWELVLEAVRKTFKAALSEGGSHE